MQEVLQYSSITILVIISRSTAYVMKKSSFIAILIILVLVVAGIIGFGGSSTDTDSTIENGLSAASSTQSAPVSETTKVSGSLLAYENAELGFSVKYPSVWQREEGNAGVTFVIPFDNKAQTTSIGTLQSLVQVFAGTCAFPPVTTGVKDRSSIKVGSNTFNMISMTNSVQGRNYFNRMYSLQKGDVCYMFSFASVTLPASSKGYTGSNATQAENNNKAVVSTADSDFTAMVKTFAFVTGPAGQDETQIAPVKK